MIGSCLDSSQTSPGHLASSQSLASPRNRRRCESHRAIFQLTRMRLPPKSELQSNSRWPHIRPRCHPVPRLPRRPRYSTQRYPPKCCANHSTTQRCCHRPPSTQYDRRAPVNLLSGPKQGVTVGPVALEALEQKFVGQRDSRLRTRFLVWDGNRLLPLQDLVAGRCIVHLGRVFGRSEKRHSSTARCLEGGQVFLAVDAPTPDLGEIYDLVVRLRGDLGSKSQDIATKVFRCILIILLQVQHRLRKDKIGSVGETETADAL